MKNKKALSLLLVSALLLSLLLAACGADLGGAGLPDEPTKYILPVESAVPGTPAAEDGAPAGPEASAPDAEPSEAAPEIDEDGEYTAPEDVAAYLHLYGRLPSNFITKNEARDLGWDSAKGNLWQVAPGKSIGGDRFGNYEGLLPAGTRYRECDVNYAGGFRGAERIIYGEDGSIWYTADHYASFTQLY